MDFDLTPEFIERKIRAGFCEMTGLPFELEQHRDYQIHPSAPSVDRLDPTKGYTMDNVQLVCFAINNIMGQYPVHIARVFARAFVNSTHGEIV